MAAPIWAEVLRFRSAAWSAASNIQEIISPHHLQDAAATANVIIAAHPSIAQSSCDLLCMLYYKGQRLGTAVDLISTRGKNQRCKGGPSGIKIYGYIVHLIK